MDSPCLSIIFLGGAIFFGLPLLKILPILMRLLATMVSGAVKWPGPIVHSPDPKASLGSAYYGLPSEHLFSTFISYTLGLIGAFVFFLLMFFSGTSLFTPYVQIQWSWATPFLILIAFVGGLFGLARANYHMAQVTTLLSNLGGGAEPRQIDGETAEAEYAIEHPLANRKTSPADIGRALQMFSESTTFQQCGNTRAALMLYQEALSIDPSLHQHARETLAQLAQACDPQDAGPIYYWLGAHSEYLLDWSQAKTSYEKAANAFCQIGYQKRESRAHCNLGNVKMRLHDSSAMEEFEKAISLNPKNGTAHLNIGRIYYSISSEGDPRYERALNAFADAIVADPRLYGPQVIASLRELGYTWKEDLEKITQRVESKRH